MTLDDLLRATMKDLAGEARPVTGLAGRAASRGRRLRRRRRTITVVTLLSIMATVSLPYALTLRAPGVPDMTAAPPVRVVPAPAFSLDQPYRVPGGLVVASIGTSERLELLNRSTGRYEQLPTAYATGVPSPGNRFVLTDPPNQFKLAVRDGVTGQTRTVNYDDTSEPRPEWSPAGDRIVFSRAHAFTVFAAATGRRADHPIPDDQVSPDYGYTWLGDGTGVALPQGYTKSDDPPRVTGLAIFDADTGELLRNVPVSGIPLGAGSWSPDDQMVLVRRSQSPSRQVFLVQASDDRTVGIFDADQAFFLPDGSILGRYGAEVTWYDPIGQPRETMTLPAALATKTLTFARP